MKKSALFIAVALIASVTMAQYTPVNSESNVSVSGAWRATGNGYIAATAKADTNAVTTTTAYTPQYVGQVLIGKLHADTNAVWISRGVTTNDWQQVAP